MNAMHISDRFAAENTIPEHQQINLISGQHFTNFNVSNSETTIREHQKINFIAAALRMFHFTHRENAIPEHEQIDRLAGWYCSYLNVSQPENSFPISK